MILNGIVLIAGLAAPVLALLGRWVWFLDLLIHFRYQETVFLFLTTVFLLARKSFKFFLLSAVMLAWLLNSILPYFPMRSETVPEDKWKIFLSNVYTPNTNYAAVIDRVKRENPDVLIFIEINQKWSDALKAGLKAAYPEIREIPREDNFGIAVYSRIPVKEVTAEYLTGIDVPCFRAVLSLGDKETVLWAVHTLPPVGAGRWEIRNRQLEVLGEKIRGESRPVIVTGDLNTSSWSYGFSMLAGKTLRDGALGKGFVGTWPTMWPRFLRTHLDHVLVSKEFGVASYRVLPQIGSDHQPVAAELFFN